jgi:hypothetical protein
MKKEDLIDVVNSFKTFDTIYDLLKKGDYSFLKRECGTTIYPEIKWLIDYFTEKEEYEKCKFLINLELPKPLIDKLNSEIEWLRLNT